MIPRATYRLQFHKDFTFADGQALAPYLACLGVSHVYASPILKARAGSSHGYDVVDHGLINPELGGDAGFHSLAAALRARGLGIILDIVPNHMAVGGADNSWWLDVLENGSTSAYEHHFDIDWESRDPLLKGKLLAPFLAAPYAEALGSGGIKLAFDERLQKLAFAYFHHRFPLRSEDYRRVLGGAASPAEADLSRFRNPENLHALLESQHFVLAWSETAGDRINWRRFFDIDELAALKIERDDVFEAVHAIPFALYSEGLIDGVRVDHIDGLCDPAAYCRKLRERFAGLEARRPNGAPRGRAYIVVEKILAHDEELPADWQVDGTTGYDFMDQISALQHAMEGESPLNSLWHKVSNRSTDFDSEEVAGREEVLVHSFESQLAATAASFLQAASSSTRSHDMPEALLQRAIVRLVAEMRVYRTYANGAAAISICDPLLRARARIRAGRRLDMALDFIGDVLAGRSGAPVDLALDATRRFNQLSAPIAAMGVEDTALYRYGRLLSRNDVGFDPRIFGLSSADFHGSCVCRASSLPNAMLTTATHDHKRGEDTRARLAVLSEMSAVWETSVREWMRLTQAVRARRIDDGDVYQLFQTLVGAWPLGLAPDDCDGLARFCRRIVDWLTKSLRESRLRTSWTEIDHAFERANREFVEAILNPQRAREFMESLCRFVGLVAVPGAANGLVQAAVRCAAPGMPDMYQGCEYWDISLVDPDNRAPVDFAARERTLNDDEQIEALLSSWRDGRIKQWLIAKILRYRAEEPDVFARGRYMPIVTQGERAGNVIAFARIHENRFAVVAGARHVAGPLAGSDALAPDRGWWGETFLQTEALAGRPVRDLFSGTTLTSLPASLRAADCLSLLPVAFLVSAPPD
ncbi:MAG TPA: malto-oligosyltrehalose synthase [Rhizomicrobium sp.]